MNLQLSRLPSDYVPRREVERRLDELTLDLGKETVERLRAVDALREETDKYRENATATRRWLIATGLTAGSACAGVLFGILSHFQ